MICIHNQKLIRFGRKPRVLIFIRTKFPVDVTALSRSLLQQYTTFTFSNSTHKHFTIELYCDVQQCIALTIAIKYYVQQPSATIKWVADGKLTFPLDESIFDSPEHYKHRAAYIKHVRNIPRTSGNSYVVAAIYRRPLCRSLLSSY